jgi:hypothetical protein
MVNQLRLRVQVRVIKLSVRGLIWTYQIMFFDLAQVACRL